MSAPDNARAASASFELEEATVAQLQGGMRSGAYTTRFITQLRPGAHAEGVGDG